MKEESYTDDEGSRGESLCQGRQKYRRHEIWKGNSAVEGEQSWLLFDAAAELFKDMALWLPCHQIPLKDPQCERQSGSRMTQLNSHFIVFHCNLIIWCYHVSKWHCLTTTSNSQKHRSVLGKICASFSPSNLPWGLHALFLVSNLFLLQYK